MKKLLIVIGGVVVFVIVVAIVKFNVINDDVYVPDGNGGYVNEYGRDIEFDNGNDGMMPVEPQQGIGDGAEPLDALQEGDQEMAMAHDASEEDAHTVDFDNIMKRALTSQEIAAIMHMREEEKLARDVYRTLHQTTPAMPFENIPRSEQTHMDVFDQLIDRYNLEDPVKDESAIGVYTDPVFSILYKDLVAKGKKSDKDAYEVGAIIEDINMSNLIKYGSQTDKEDLDLAYSTLLVQSKNHARAFVKNLQKLGGSYTPQYVDQAVWDDAVDGEMGHKGGGRGMRGGDRKSGQGRQ